jgi:hypothetical protein
MNSRNNTKDVDGSDNTEKKKELQLNNNNNKDNDVKYEKLGVGAFFRFTPDLYGFYISFILMIILPLSSFFITRSYFRNKNYLPEQQDTYAAISVICTVWLILITISVYYFHEDCKSVFCSKQTKRKSD